MINGQGQTNRLKGYLLYKVCTLQDSLATKGKYSMTNCEAPGIFAPL